MDALIADIAGALSEHGLILRGSVQFGDDELRPTGPSAVFARSALLVGHGGASFWPYFQRWKHAQPADTKHPLDSWAREVIGGIAARFGGWAVSPSDRPFMPFQRWAMRAEGLKPSPLGVLMHPVYGPWHAYRGAILFETEIASCNVGSTVHLCDGCSAKPCMMSCPVRAHPPSGFAYKTCLTFVRSSQGDECRDGGCLDRNACPFGAVYRYPGEVQAFFMKAFAG